MSPLFKHQCAKCGYEWQDNNADASPCDNCRMGDLFAQLPPETINVLDQKIFGKAILEGISLLKETIHISLADARDLHYWRYLHLREISAEKFQHSPDEYWSGFFS